MSKVELSDTPFDIIVKMSDGNPGAMMAVTTILQEAGAIDPDAMFGGIGIILLLDTWEIYGTDIYVLFNDKCQRNVRKFLVLIRANQLGFLPKSKLIEMSKDQMRSVDLTQEVWDDIDSQVCERLDNFQKP